MKRAVLLLIGLWWLGIVGVLYFAVVTDDRITETAYDNDCAERFARNAEGDCLCTYEFAAHCPDHCADCGRAGGN